uniref:Trem-like transcript 2 protein n=2 Tax=Sus scrofa TaxID=9823 RepID=A0A8D1KHP5_PIG
MAVFRQGAIPIGPDSRRAAKEGEGSSDPESSPCAGRPQTGWSSHTCPKFRGRGGNGSSTALLKALRAPAVCWSQWVPQLTHFPKWATSLLEPQAFPGRPEWHVQPRLGALALDPCPVRGWCLSSLHGAMVSTFLLLPLLLLWLQGPFSGVSLERVFSKVHHFEGETLSVQCSYKGRKHHVEGKVWCKVRRKKCETGFPRAGVQGPRYLLQDDTRAKVVTITMAALRRQDSGRYWCMRNSSGTLYPLMSFLLEVSPASTTKRNTPLTKLATVLKSGTVVPTGPIPTSGPESPFTTSVPVLTAGFLTLARLLPSPTGTVRRTSVTGTSPSTLEPRGTTGSQTVTASPSSARAPSAGPASTSTEAGCLPTGLPATTSRPRLNRLSPRSRHQDSYPIVLLGVLALLPVPVMLIMVYGFWKKRHMGSYSISRGPARSWRHPPARLESPQKPIWSEAI